MRPTKPPTNSEYAVIAFLISAALIIAGVAGFAFALFATPEKKELALQLNRLSSVSLAGGILVILVVWLFRKFTD